MLRTTDKTFFDKTLFANRLQGAIDYDLHVATTQLYRGDNPALRRFKANQHACLQKKLPSDDRSLEAKTLHKFTENLLRMCEVNRTWGQSSPKTTLFRRRVAALIEYVLPEFSWEEVFEAARLGPGTTRGTSYELSNIENKWAYPLTVTPGCKDVMDQYFRWDSQLDESVRLFNKMETAPRYRVVQGNRITTVAKTREIRRVIAIEPTCNMFLQQGLMCVIERALAPFGIDLSVQQNRHHRWVYLASLSKKLATIDFSMASDSLSLALVRCFLPPKWFNALMRLRSPAGCFSEKEERYIQWPIISSMGNAGTFPLETLIFWAMAHVASTRYKGNSIIPDLRHHEIVSAFGDDVILPTASAQFYIEQSEACGLLVNQDKSFWDNEDGFRESCGVDVFDYRNIRAFYLKSLPLSTRRRDRAAWLCGLVNRFLPIGFSFLGDLPTCYASSTLRVLLKELAETGVSIPLVPDFYPDEAGLRLFNLPLVRQAAEQYGVKLRYPSHDIHGTINFRFFSAKFGKKPAPRSECLTYATNLKNFVFPERPRLYLRKTGLRYVVKTGATCHQSWDGRPITERLR